jgi:hypothetical protein
MSLFSSHQWLRVSRLGVDLQMAATAFAAGAEAGRDDFIKRLQELNPDAARQFVEHLNTKGIAAKRPEHD